MTIPIVSSLAEAPEVAGALIIAEIERLDRQAIRGGKA